MLTKYVLTIGETEHDIPDECLKNWDEIAFSLKRTGYSGVMRSFSTEFVFVGEIYDLLFAEYLDKGFLAEASVAVYTITNTHTWELQYSAALDFSTIEIESGSLSINAMDNALASLLKSKKSQKYQYPVSDFSTVDVEIKRIELKSYGKFKLNGFNWAGDQAHLIGLAMLEFLDASSQVISEEYIKLSNETTSNSFFAVGMLGGASMTYTFQGRVRCYLDPVAKDSSLTHISTMPVSRLDFYADNQLDSSSFVRISTMSFDDDLKHKLIHGVRAEMMINSNLSSPFSTLDALKTAALARYGAGGAISSDYNGIFGIVGSDTNPANDSYWANNTVYEYSNGWWYGKGSPGSYYQDRSINETGTIGSSYIRNGSHIQLRASDKISIRDGEMTVSWSDPIRSTLSCRCIPPLQLITKIVRSITGAETVVSIAEDEAGLLANTLLLPGEELRQISTANVYGTFQNFCDWIEAVFGYTYRVTGDELQFVHRSAVFVDEVVKVIDNYRDLNFSIEDDLIYTTVEAGYSKKDYGEIDGRLEKNFTNYYSTGYSLTDKKLSLISKYRADSYGIEFTARKSESSTETKDDKADEDVFVICYTADATSGELSYEISNNNAYNPSVCIENNKAFIAALGNGAAVMLTMTSSDGDNTLTDVTVAAGTNLFTAAEIEFTTDDMELPGDLNALVQIDHDGCRYKGYISQADARFGRLNGVEYKLIVRSIEEI